jgi:hypothetical protein
VRKLDPRRLRLVSQPNPQYAAAATRPHRRPARRHRLPPGPLAGFSGVELEAELDLAG